MKYEIEDIVGFNEKEYSFKVIRMTLLHGDCVTLSYYIYDIDGNDLFNKTIGGVFENIPKNRDFFRYFKHDLELDKEIKGWDNVLSAGVTFGSIDVTVKKDKRIIREIHNKVMSKIIEIFMELKKKNEEIGLSKWLHKKMVMNLKI